jgi:hypothetical protein
MTPAPITPTRNARLASVLAPDPDPFEFMSSSPTDFRQSHPGVSPSTPPQMWRMPSALSGHVLIQRITLFFDTRFPNQSSNQWLAATRLDRSV